MKTQTFYAQPYRFFHHKRLIIIRVTVLTTSLHLIFYLHLIFEQIRRQFPFLLLILNLKCGICFFSEKKIQIDAKLDEDGPLIVELACLAFTMLDFLFL